MRPKPTFNAQSTLHTLSYQVYKRVEDTYNIAKDTALLVGLRLTREKEIIIS